jgi:heat shock protein HtpX
MHSRSHCHRNQLKATALLAGVCSLALVAGVVLAGPVGLVLGLILSVVVIFTAYFASDRISLRSMRARPVSEATHPELGRVVREIAMMMRLPMPAVYVSPTSTPNAFATGRNPRRSAICVTEGLLSLLDTRQLRAVIAHEMAHVKNRDILVSSVATALGSMIMYVAYFAWLLPSGGADDDDNMNPVGALLLLLLGPVAASFIRLAIARSRELEADRMSAQITGDPMALADALHTIEWSTERQPMPVNPELRSTAALMIANPFGRNDLGGLFSTHPPTAQRIERLEALAGRHRLF